MKIWFVKIEICYRDTIPHCYYLIDLFMIFDLYYTSCTYVKPMNCMVHRSLVINNTIQKRSMLRGQDNLNNWPSLYTAGINYTMYYWANFIEKLELYSSSQNFYKLLHVCIMIYNRYFDLFRSLSIYYFII